MPLEKKYATQYRKEEIQSFGSTAKVPGVFYSPYEKDFRVGKLELKSVSFFPIF